MSVPRATSNATCDIWVDTPTPNSLGASEEKGLCYVHVDKSCLGGWHTALGRYVSCALGLTLLDTHLCGSDSDLYMHLHPSWQRPQQFLWSAPISQTQTEGR
jgi:hypothetical protein